MKTRANKKLTFKKNAITELNTVKLIEINAGGPTNIPTHVSVRHNTTILCKTVTVSYNDTYNP